MEREARAAAVLCGEAAEPRGEAAELVGEAAAEGEGCASGVTV